MSLLCDNCADSAGVWGGCEAHKPVRVGDSCESFRPTVESVFGSLSPTDPVLAKSSIGKAVELLASFRLIELLSRGGLVAVIRDLIECCRFNGYPEAETKKMVMLIPQIVQYIAVENLRPKGVKDASGIPERQQETTDN